MCRGTDELDTNSSSEMAPARAKEPVPKNPTYDLHFELRLASQGLFVHNSNSEAKGGTELQSSPRNGVGSNNSDDDSYNGDGEGTLSASQFSDDAFKDFLNKNAHAMTKIDIRANVIPCISGYSNIQNCGGVFFNNLRAMKDIDNLFPTPDFYDGAAFTEVNDTVRDDLKKLIMPADTSKGLAPLAPNFFLQITDAKSDFEMAQRQVCFQGAFGARAIHALQDYGKDEEQYDGKAYTYSAIYERGSGGLNIFAHHVTAPSSPDGRPEYHMTNVLAQFMKTNVEDFRHGARVFREFRELARRHRDKFIKEANEMAVRLANQKSQSTPSEDDV